MANQGSILGNSVQRKEDPALITGVARYVDDLPVTGVLSTVFVRSTVAHATITSIDTAAARSMPGVVAIYTADDLGVEPQAGFIFLPAFARPPLATGKVRFVGETVVAVVAETRAQAVDAAEAVVVEYDVLPAVTDAEAALAPDAPEVWPDIGMGGKNICFGLQPEKIDDLFDEADVVVKGRFVNQRLAAVPMENNGIVVEHDGSGGLCAWVATQAPHGVRDGLAGALGLAPEQVRVIAPAVGGGFGAKTGTYAEFIVVAKAALLLGRPVKWAETRSENMVSMSHGRGQIQYVEMGLRRDGTIVGLRVRVIADGGAYPAIGAFLPFLTKSMAQGVYEIPRIEFNSVSVATNTTTTAAYRGAGRPEATALLERIIDLAAVELAIDPAELRRRNLIAADRFPLTTVTGSNYDVGDYVKALDEALKVSGYAELRAEQAARRQRGDTVALGIGVSAYVEVTAGGLFTEYGACEVGADGKVTVKAGTSSHGQGHDTSFAMIAAEILGVSIDDVTLVQSDTALIPRGQGTMGSRSLQIGGSAIYKASETVLDKARQLAAHLLEASPDDIVAVDGRVGVAGTPSASLSWAELATAAADPARLPAGMEPGLAAELDFNQGDATYPFGSHVAVVEVDLETGGVTLVRHIAVDDCGRRLNPMLVAGQQHGGIAQGVAQVLFEGVEYDSDGNPHTASLMDYLVPSAAELPSFEASNTETPTPKNPLGAKGIGESGTIGSTPAVHSAVVDALAHLGITHLDMPVTPAKIWAAVAAARSAG
jgi:aerobic carbon-monoxide dehydrogenase large subunit